MDIEPYQWRKTTLTLTGEVTRIRAGKTHPIFLKSSYLIQDLYIFKRKMGDEFSFIFSLSDYMNG
jgi:hypothetical protein